MLTEKVPSESKSAEKYSCKSCDFICSKQSNFMRHCSTRKHKLLTDISIVNKSAIEKDYHICSHCKKEYLSREGLWKHSKKCTSKISSDSDELILKSDDDMSSSEPIKNYIMKLVEQNNDLRNMFLQQNNELLEIREQNNQIQTLIIEQPPQQITNIHKTTNNTQFNLNVFLQHTCKDAINMSDFIDSLKINTKTLERTGTHGYVNGISKIFTDGLRKLKVHERPIHCSDLKREVLYIKDNDKWEKDTEDNKQFKKALATVVHRNMIQIVKWEEDNPETSNPESKNYEFYFELARQSMGGGNHEVTARNNEKILKAIAKEVHIDKKVKELL